MAMSRTAEFIRVLYDTTRKSNSFGRCLKHVELISADNGKCKAEFEVQEAHVNYAGTLHGGFISTLVDCISTYALMSNEDKGLPGISVDLHVTFMKAAFPGDVISIDAKTVKAGKSMAFLQVDLTKKDDGALIARGIQTKFFGGK